MKIQFVLQHRYASAPQAAPVCARAGGARKQKPSRVRDRSRAGCGKKKTVPVALLLCGPAERREEKEMRKTSRARRTASVDAKRGQRALGRVWQHGFSHASAGWSANCRHTAHARSAAGILPVLRLLRTPGAAAFAAPATTIAKPNYNRDRYQSRPDSLLLRA